MKIISSIIVGAILTLVMITGLSFVAQPILADDHDDENYEFREHYGGYEENEEDKGLEAGGELLGWGTVIVMGGAAVLMPLRRGSSKLMKTFPNAKSVIRSVLKFFSKIHIWLGLFAIGISGIHGTLLFLHEGEIESEVILGSLSFSLMVISSIFGLKLAKNKGIKNLRSIHIGLIVATILVVIVHVLAS